MFTVKSFLPPNRRARRKGFLCPAPRRPRKDEWRVVYRVPDCCVVKDGKATPATSIPDKISGPDVWLLLKCDGTDLRSVPTSPTPGPLKSYPRAIRKVSSTVGVHSTSPPIIGLASRGQKPKPGVLKEPLPGIEPGAVRAHVAVALVSSRPARDGPRRNRTGSHQRQNHSPSAASATIDRIYRRPRSRTCPRWRSSRTRPAWAAGRSASLANAPVASRARQYTRPRTRACGSKAARGRLR